MHEAVASPLTRWESFYVIVGSSAAALTGLQFVVIALLAETRRQSSTREIDAFATPTIVHFAFVLLLSAILSAPWPGLSAAAITIGMCGGAGLTYAVLVVVRARRQTGYQMVMEDWIWHTVLPTIAYAALFASAFTLGRRTLTSLFVIGGTALLLLFIGIHNAWDTVTYIAIDHLATHDPPREPTDAVR